MYALSHYTRGTLGLVNLFCRTWSISSLNGVKFYAEGGKWECRHQHQSTVHGFNVDYFGGIVYVALKTAVKIVSFTSDFITFNQVYYYLESDESSFFLERNILLTNLIKLP